MLNPSVAHHLKLIDLSPIGLALCKMDGSLVYVNAVYANIVGYSTEEMLELSYWELTPEDYKAQEQIQLNRLNETGRYGPYEKEYIHKNGSRVYVCLNGVLVEIDGESYIWSSAELIDDYKRIEEALRRSEYSLNKAQQVASIGSWTWDIVKNKLYWSDNIYRIFGLKPQEFEATYEAFLAHVHPEDQEYVTTEVNMALEGVREYNIDHRVIQSNDHEIIVHEQAEVERSPEGDAITMHGTVQDVTKSRSRDYELQLFKNAIDSSADAIYIIDYDSQKFINANKSALLSTGYSKEELLELGPQNLKPEFSKQQLKDLFEPLISGKKSEVFMKTIHKRKDDSVFPVEINVSMINRHLGHHVLVASVRDISEREQIELRLKELGQALNQSGEAVIITDKKGNIEYVNSAFTIITGYSSEEAVGQTPRLLKSSAQDPAFYREMWETITQGKIWSGSLIDRRKDGSFYPVLMSVSPIFNETREIVKFVSIHQDMTEFKSLEQQFQQSQKLEALGTLVGGIAHDFNNMLAGIMGNAYLGKMHAEIGGAEKVTANLSTIEDLCDKAAGMIQQLLAFARKGWVEKEWFSFATFIDETIKLSETGIPANIQLTVVPADSDALLYGDTNLLHQVIINLLNNARDAVEGAASPAIRIECKLLMDASEFPGTIESDMAACLTISDNGYGISQENIGKVFEPFFSTKGVGKGTGLGLSMVYGTVQSHGGVLEVESNKEAGTRFTIYFPASESKSAQEASSSQHVAQGQHECILIADDDQVIRESIFSVFSMLNYKCLIASDGLEAIELFKEHQHEIHAVLLDVIMPKLGGVEAARSIHEMNGDIPIAFMSGYDKEEFSTMQNMPEGTKLISKPFSIENLSQTMRSMLDK